MSTQPLQSSVGDLGALELLIAEADQKLAAREQTFKDRAIPIALRGVPVIRLQPRLKIPMDKSWTTKATTDVDTILLWNSETPNANCGSVAKANGFLFFETDEPGVIERYERETGEKLPKTFTASSRKDRYHFYFAQTDESRSCGNIVQGEKGITFGSLRQNNEYVVSPGSIHPDTGLPYTVVDDSPIVPVPASLIIWLQSQVGGGKKKSEPTTATPENATRHLVPHGQIHAALVKEAGRMI